MGMPIMLEPFSDTFMRLAFLGGTLVGIVSGYLGVFIVQRRMAFLGSGLSHAAFGGVALGILLGVEPLWIALPFTVAVSIAIVLMRERTALAEDTAIGIMFSVSMALGVLFLFWKQGYTSDAFTYLFGSVLALSKTDVLLAGGMTIATAATLPLWGSWAYASFDRNLARTDRLQVIRHDCILAVAMALAIVISVKLVGIVLIAAFLVLPAATARLLSTSFRQMTVLAVVIGAVTPAIGLYLSYFSNVPPGAFIVLLQAALFFAVLVPQWFRR